MTDGAADPWHARRARHQKNKSTPKPLDAKKLLQCKKRHSLTIIVRFIYYGLRPCLASRTDLFFDFGRHLEIGIWQCGTRLEVIIFDFRGPLEPLPQKNISKD